MRHRSVPSIHTQKYIPLEDRVFIYSFFILSTILFVTFQINAYIQNEHLSETQEKEIVEAITVILDANIPNKQTALPKEFSKNSQEHSGQNLGIVSPSEYASICEGQVFPCTIATANGKFFLLKTQTRLSANKTLAISKSTIDSLVSKPMSQFKILLLTLGIATAFSVTTRLLLHAIVFKNLDKITKVIFARRIFEATGSIAKDFSGREIDGRIHFFTSNFTKLRTLLQRILDKLFSKNQTWQVPIRNFQTITLTRTPEPPKIPLEEFSNDELGRLALALEEDNQKQQLYEQLFEGLLEKIPMPIIATARDGSFFLVNQRFHEIFPAQEGNGSQQEKVSNAKTSSNLAIPEDLIAAAIRVLDQRSPRVFAKEYTFRTIKNTKTYPVSITTLSKFGKRVAIICIHENLSSEATIARNALRSISSRQLDIAQQLTEKINVLHENQAKTSLHIHSEALTDLINTQLDILHNGSEEITHDVVEFSLPQLLASVARIVEPNPVEINIDPEIPRKIVSSPSHIKHFLIAVLHEFFILNRTTARIIANYSLEESILEISVSAAEKANRIQDASNIDLLRFLARSYQIALAEKPENAREFVGFSSSAKISHNKQDIPFTMLSSLKSKKLLVVVASPESCNQPVEVIKSSGSSEIILQDFPTFRSSTNNFSLYDAAILLSGALLWQNDQDLLRIADVLKEKSVPILLIPQTPRRGDSAEATKFGFSGYLRRPFSTVELQEILFTLCNKETLGKAFPKGIITRYAANELSRTTHQVIVATLFSQDEPIAKTILASLTSIGFTGAIAIGIHDIIRQLFDLEKAILFYPSCITTGQKRQLTIATEGRVTFAYDSPKHELMEDSVTALQNSTVFVTPPYTKERILKYIQGSLENLPNEEPAHSARKRRQG